MASVFRRLALYSKWETPALPQWWITEKGGKLFPCSTISFYSAIAKTPPHSNSFPFFVAFFLLFFFSFVLLFFLPFILLLTITFLCFLFCPLYYYFLLHFLLVLLFPLHFLCVFFFPLPVAPPLSTSCSSLLLLQLCSSTQCALTVE